MPATSSDRSFRLIATGVLLCLWAAATILATELIEYSRNTLQINGRWVSSKALMEISVMGSRHFLDTRIALHRNRLNLGEWHAYNEVHLGQRVAPSEMEARFRLAPGAYLDVIVDRRETGHQGIRFSRDDRFPSEWYRAERTGRIVERGPVAVSPARLAGGWHELHLAFIDAGVRPSIDGNRLALVPLRIEGDRYIGFGGGRAKAVVGRVRLVGPRGEILLDETFRNRRGYGVIAIIVGVLGLIVVFPAAAPLLFREPGLAMRRAAYRGITLLAVALVLLSAGYAFDYVYWSSRYVYGGFLPNQARPFALAVRSESLRSRIFRMEAIESLSRAEDSRAPAALHRSISAWTGPRTTLRGKIARFRDLAPLAPIWLDDAELAQAPAKPAGVLRVGFLGTSQTYGVGAETVSDTFVARAHTRLAAELGGVPLETYNFSIPGSESSELLRHYRDSWGLVRPDLLVVNLSNNDDDSGILLENLRALVEQTRRSGGEIVFVLEANSIERELADLLRRHGQMRELGAGMAVPVWDLHGYLASDGVYDSGRLWWDEVHLSSHGQSLAADWLAARMIPLLRDRLARLARLEPTARRRLDSLGPVTGHRSFRSRNAPSGDPFAGPERP